MADCYRCGTPLGRDTPRARRKVEVGDDTRVGVSSRGRVWVSGGTRHALRTLCLPCAEEVDRADALVGNVLLGLFLFGLLLVLAGLIFG